MKIADEAFREAIRKIQDIELSLENKGKLKVPNYSNKIKYNQLSNQISYWLSNSDFQFNVIEEHFKLKPENRRIIKEKLRGLYFQEKKEYEGKLKENNDLIFVSMFNKISENVGQSAKFAVLCLLSYFFIRCDIFEEPKKC